MIVVSDKPKLQANIPKDNIISIGMDTHKAFCEIAHECDERTALVKHYGSIKITKPAI
jgi:hypothetical protein